MLYPASVWGWSPNGTAGTAPLIFSVAGNSIINAPANTANRLGVANVPVWTVASRAAAAPFYKGLSQAPSGLTRAFVQALYTAGVAGTKLRVVPSATGAAGSVDIFCAPGYFGTPLLAVSASGAAALLPTIASYCSPCTRPAALSASVQFLNVSALPGEPGNFLLTCGSGAYSPSGGLGRTTCSSDAAVPTYSLPATAVCVATPPGSYSPDGVNLYTCPAGTFGAASGLTTSACSGQCAPGFYCPAGSTSATQIACGGPTVFCPASSAAPLPCPNSSFTGPLATGRYPAAPPTTRYTCTPCPADQLCSGGALLPAVDFTVSCAGNAIFAALGADASGNRTIANALFGPSLYAATPGWAGPVAYNLSSVVPNNAKCPLNASSISFNASAGSLQIGSVSASALLCQAGIVATLVATRVGNALESTPPKQDVCVVTIVVPEIAIAPEVTVCNSSVAVPEFSPVGTVVSPAFLFTNREYLPSKPTTARH